jgi:hypothetical protein
VDRARIGPTGRCDLRCSRAGICATQARIAALIASTVATVLASGWRWI